MGNHLDHLAREVHELSDHPGAEYEQGEESDHDLGNKGDGHLLDLGDGLKEADEEAHHETEEQGREADQQQRFDGLSSQADDEIGGHGVNLNGSS